MELANLVTEHLGELITANQPGIDRIPTHPAPGLQVPHGCGLKAW
jgi:hypothetical protein